METSSSRSGTAPWFKYYSHSTCSPHLPSSLTCPYTHYNNMASHNSDQHPNSLIRSIADSGIVKPKALRITCFPPIPRFSVCQEGLGSDLEGFGVRHENTYRDFSFLPRSMHDLSSHHRVLSHGFPYLFPCAFSLSEPPSTEKLFHEMLQNQMSFLHFHDTPDYKRHQIVRCNVGNNIINTPDIPATVPIGLINQNFNTCQMEQVGSTYATQKRLLCPKNRVSKDANLTHKLQGSKRNIPRSYKLSYKSLKNSRKQCMSPLNKSTNQERRKDMESLQKSVKVELETELRKLIYFSTDKSSKDNCLTEKISFTSSGNAPLNSDICFPKVSLVCDETHQVSSESNRFEYFSTEDNGRAKTAEVKVIYSNNESFPEDKKTFKCPQCRYLTDRKNNLKRHIVTMHQESSKILECCGVGFQNKAALRDHNAIFHRGGYRCQICSRNFCRKALLRRHLTVHSGQKDFFCNICGYATSHKSNLERHQRVHIKRDATVAKVKKRTSFKVSPRIEVASSLHNVSFDSREPHCFHNNCGTDSISPKCQGKKASNKNEIVLLHNKHQGEKSVNSFTEGILEAYTKKLHNINILNVRNIQNHKRSELNIQDKYDDVTTNTAAAQGSRKKDSCSAEVNV